MMRKFILIGLLSLALAACATTHGPAPRPNPTVATLSELQQGKRLFEAGYYKRAMKVLLPLACGCPGNAEAQYAVGYMYYYGYGVAQDTDVGYFWIKKSADQGNEPAIKALATIDQQNIKKI